MLKTDKAVDGTPISELSVGSEKRVQLVCDTAGCRRVTETLWRNYIQYQRKRGFTGETFCQPCVARKTGDACRGKTNPKTADRNRKQRAEKHPSWKGGRYTDAHGYVMVRVEKGRAVSGSGWDQYRKEHTVLMEEAVGRPLTKDEVVHHLDLVKSNNALLNLWLTTHKGHRDAHHSLQLIGAALYAAGLVIFDRDKGIYTVADLKLRELLGHPGGGNQQPSPSSDARKGSETRRRVPSGR